MAITVNTNITSKWVQASLNQANSDLQVSIRRLSTGLRVFDAQSGPAETAIAATITTFIRGNQQAIRNANDGIALGQTAESALGQLNDNLQRIRELAVQASNGTIGNENRSQIQKEVDQLTGEISRIVQTAQFNGISLLSGTTTLMFQIGSSGAASNQISMSTTDLTAAGVFNSYNTNLTNTGTIDVTTQAGASAVLAPIDSDLSIVSNTRAAFGAVGARFEKVSTYLQSYTTNLEAAKSRMIDVDYADEAANMAKTQILQQVGAPILKMANEIPAIAIALIQ